MCVSTYYMCVKGKQVHLLLADRWHSPPGVTDTHAHTPAASRCVCRATRRCDRLKQTRGWMDRYRVKEWLENTEFGESTLKFKVKLKFKDETYSAHWVRDYLYILRWYRSHQNILLVDTSTSRATAFFRVGTTCVYSFFSRSIRRISWRLVNIRYGLFPDGEVKDVRVMITYEHILEDHFALQRLNKEDAKLRCWMETLDRY